MELTTKSFKHKVIQSDLPVLMECWASWCLPCKQIDPTLNKLAEKYQNKCKIFKVNLDRNPVISRDYNVKGLPTFMTFLNGQEFERRTGSQTDTQLEAMITKVIQEYHNQSKTELDEDEIIENTLKDLGYL